MANLVLMPRLSDTMEEGTVIKWHKNIGDTVKAGDLLAEIETDKAVQEFESEYKGVLLYQGVQEGSSVPVDTPLAIVGNEGEDFQALLGGGNSSTPAPAQTSQTVETPTSSTEPFTMPEGVNIIQLPRLSDTMETGTVAKWNKKVGDEVKIGDLITEIETDKAVQEFESEYKGTLLHIGVEEGSSAPVDSILAIIGPAGTDISAIVKAGGIPQTEKTTDSTPSTSTQTTTQTTTTPTQNSGDRVFASPLAKKIAEDKGIDIKEVTGSGEMGRIIKRDVEQYTPKTANTSATSSTVQVFAPAGETIETPVSQMRKVIAKRLAESKFTAPHFYLTLELDMDQAMASRVAINNLPDTKVSFNDMVIKACAVALRKHPMVNSSWGGDKIITHGDINIGVAVAINDGLVVPVVKTADYLSLTQISASVKDLAFRAKERKLGADEMSGSTFTISNMGMFGIESFTSIINQPNSCILSVGAIVQKPVVKNGQIVIGNTMKVTLACDHRTVDGSVGAAYLQTLKALIENPVTLLA